MDGWGVVKGRFRQFFIVLEGQAFIIGLGPGNALKFCADNRVTVYRQVMINLVFALFDHADQVLIFRHSFDFLKVFMLQIYLIMYISTKYYKNNNNNTYAYADVVVL